MQKQERFRIGLIQMDSGQDRRKNFEKARELAGEAAARQANLILFPETVDYIGPDFRGNASDPSGETVCFFQELSRRHGVYLLAGSVTEKRPGGRPANASFLFNPEGKKIACYRKLHMFDVDIADGPAYRESDEIQPGNEIVVVRTRLGVFGIAICYDLRFGEMFRLMARAGAQVILLVANFTRETGQAHWETLIRARAIENGCYVAACAQTGQKSAFWAYGNSMVTDPWGRVIARAGDQEAVLTADVDLAYGKHVQRQIPSLKNTREDIYNLECLRMRIYEE